MLFPKFWEVIFKSSEHYKMLWKHINRYNISDRPAQSGLQIDRPTGAGSPGAPYGQSLLKLNIYVYNQ